jgi:hypothetical protein
MLSTITVTSDCTLDVVLNGAGGGNGGSDARHTGAIGSPGDKVSVKINALAGQVYYVSTGSAGLNGSSNVRGTGGGSGGYAYDGFSGGSGGNAGGAGTSGAGGGGGGATLLYTFVNGIRKNLAVAAGGAGGGGAGNYSNGTDFQSISRVSAYYLKRYTSVTYPTWSSTLKNYGVKDDGGTYTLSYGIYVTTGGPYVLYSSADDQASLYVNNVYVGASSSWASTSKHNITLNPGYNDLRVTVVNSGGGPTGWGGYITTPNMSTIWTSAYNYNVFDGIYNLGRGGQGQSNLGDGGGAGGGGGGYLGGAGGTAAGGGYGGDHGGASGYPGVSFAPTGDYEASSAIKDQWSTVDRASITILGGASRNTNGSFTVSSLTTDVKVYQSSYNYTYPSNFVGPRLPITRFVPVNDIKYKNGSTWSDVKEVYVKESNVWVPVFKKDTFTITSQAGGASPENNTSGYIVPYSPSPQVVYNQYDSGGESTTSTTPSGDGPGWTTSDGISVTDGSGNAVGSGGGGDGGDSKIICTAMNEAYGFGSFRNAIWIKYADKHLTKTHEVGYHTLFLPLVDYGFKQGDGKLNIIVRRILEWGTRHRSMDLRAEMRGKKRHLTGRIIRLVFEPMCYIVGKIKGH